MKQISNQPLKGYADWLPKEYAIRSYIFKKWRSVCKKFGYKEYLTPLLEDADIYRAKSGEEVGGQELMTCTDRAGRELAIRPEMTPSITRLVSRIYEQETKPLRLFSIANFIRNQNPQKGRNREFWQLNFDIFGTDSISADIEIIQMGIEIMLAFGAKEGSFACLINSRELIDFILKSLDINSKELITKTVRVMDRKDKYDKASFIEQLLGCGLSAQTANKIASIMELTKLDDIKDILPKISETEGFKKLEKIINTLEKMGYSKFIKYSPSIIRGFDYYDGTIFEFFNLKGGRSIFGGGRYNGLARIFGSNNFPAVGMAPGDETTRIFLEEWNLLPDIKSKKTVLISVFDENSYIYSQKVAQKLREQGYFTELFTEENQAIGKQLKYANKKQFDFVAIAGPDEQKMNTFILKDMRSSSETVIVT